MSRRWLLRVHLLLHHRGGRWRRRRRRFTGVIIFNGTSLVVLVDFGGHISIVVNAPVSPGLRHGSTENTRALGCGLRKLVDHFAVSVVICPHKNENLF